MHGCPFKTLEKDALAAALTRMRIAPHYVNEAVTKAKAGHYQLACGVAFEGQHGGCACDAGINHPNQVTVSVELRSGSELGRRLRDRVPTSDSRLEKVQMMACSVNEAHSTTCS